MTPKQLSKKPLEVWYRTYFGKVSPMLRVYANKKREEYVDYNILLDDIKKFILVGINTNKFTITEHKKPRYPVIKFNFYD